MARLASLLDGLEAHDFRTLFLDGVQAGVQTPGGHATVAMTAADDWVQVSQTLIESETLDASPHAAAVYELALRLHARFLGCRFGLDEDRSLAIQYDVYPDAAADHVAAAINQLMYVAAAALPLFIRALAQGRVADDDIDRAFEDADDLA